MQEDYRQLLKPKIINSISGLSLIARVVVEGYLAGLNRSRRVGAGLEFSQYRGYEPGDDLRLLDWKMLARSGRYYIKQSEIDTHISVKFIIDASKSMVYEELGLSKLDYLKVLTASLAYLAQKQGDAVGLYAFNDQQLTSLQPTVHKQHFNRFLHQLIEIQGEGRWPATNTTLDKIHDRSRKELLFFITDMYEYEDELSGVLNALKTSRNEVVVLRLMGAKEMEFDYKGFVIFEDLETGTDIKVHAKEAKKVYLEGLRQQLVDLENKLLSKGIGYQLFKLGQPIGETLHLFLKKRNTLL